MSDRRNPVPEGTQKRGGPWTEQKLRVVSDYLHAYCTALKKQGFSTLYIDAFAGAGTEYLATSRNAGNLFDTLAEAETQRLLRGSARRALECVPPFDRYVLIEKDVVRCEDLRLLADCHARRHFQVEVIHGDANEVVPRECGQLQRDAGDRGVVFLDPYGMQVKWSTIESIANTKALDLWVLFPLGVAVNRLVVRAGVPDIPESWQRRLDQIFGTRGWRDHFYGAVSRPTLFGSEEVVRRVRREAIGAYFIERLEAVFEGGVVKKPGVLRNSKGIPLYLLCFAVANPAPKAKVLALKIANDLLRDIA